MGRWIAKEVKMIAQIRQTLKTELANRPQFPEVVGDRRILRFLRGKQHNIEEATTMIRAFLQWRLDNKVDDVRQDILYGGKDSPYNFPKGKLIIDLAPQIVLSVNALDKRGQPLSLEQYNFSPKEVFKAVSMDDYLKFLTYCLEYRALVMEQLSHERELAYLAAHPNESERQDGYGVIVMDFTIRDLKGVGMAHLGSEGRALVAAALKMGLPNYQEYMAKSHMVNVPWVFSSMWYFVKGMLDEFTLAKLTLSGADYMDTLLKDVPFDSIPERLGGGFKLYNEHYTFDLSPEGALYYEGAPSAPATISGSSSSKRKLSKEVSLLRINTSQQQLPFIDNDGSTTVSAAISDKRPRHNHKQSSKVGAMTATGDVIEKPSQQQSNASVLLRISGRIRRSIAQFRTELWSVFRDSPYFSVLVATVILSTIVKHRDQVMQTLLPSGTVYLLLTLLFVLL